MNVKKLSALFLSLTMVMACVFSAASVSAETTTTLVNAYIRIDNNPIPYDQDASAYDMKTQGYLTVAEDCYNLNGVSDRLVREPSVVTPDGMEVLWYEIVNDGGKWRMHGVFIPSDEVTIVDVPLETDKDGNVVKSKTTIIIPEKATGDMVIPLDFLNQFDNNVSMPGDTYDYYFTVVNRSKLTYSYRDASFQVLVDGDMSDPKWQKFYEKLFSISFTRPLDMSDPHDTDCGIANYLDPANQKYKDTNTLLTRLLDLQPGAQSAEQILYIGLNGPLMGNEYAGCSFGGEMKFVMTPTSQTEPPEETGEKVAMRIATARRMAVRFEDGNFYYNNDTMDVQVGKEYKFQICSVNWENGKCDDNGNGIKGTVVYTLKVVHQKDFIELRKQALKDPDRYTVKGIDIIDNDNKTIIVNCDAENFHLETDVNNFFMAYRYHFTKGDYNKQTGIKQVVDPPLESLSVNLPLGSTIQSDAYKDFKQIDSKNVFIERGEDLALSYTDYYWEY